MKPRTRRLKVGIANVKVDPSWGDATLTITQYGPDRREVIISIKNPWDLAYLRVKLTEIETYWRKTLQ